MADLTIGYRCGSVSRQTELLDMRILLQAKPGSPLQRRNAINCQLTTQISQHALVITSQKVTGCTQRVWGTTPPFRLIHDFFDRPLPPQVTLTPSCFPHFPFYFTYHFLKEGIDRAVWVPLHPGKGGGGLQYEKPRCVCVCVQYGYEYGPVLKDILSWAENLPILKGSSAHLLYPY